MFYIYIQKKHKFNLLIVIGPSVNQKTTINDNQQYNTILISNFFSIESRRKPKKIEVKIQ